MGKILILYDSKSGNTEKMAQFVKEGAESFGENEVRLLKVDNATHKDIE